MITKNPIRVGGAEAVDSASGLPMYRKFTNFDGGREQEQIRVFYEEYLMSEEAILNRKLKHYIVKDIAAQGHWNIGNPEAVPPTVDEFVETVAAYPAFSEGWYFKKIVAKSDGLYVGGVNIAPLNYELNFGEDLIVAAINATLQAMPFAAENGYITQP
jgi:hypothetical protein